MQPGIQWYNSIWYNIGSPPLFLNSILKNGEKRCKAFRMHSKDIFSYQALVNNTTVLILDILDADNKIYIFHQCANLHCTGMLTLSGSGTKWRLGVTLISRTLVYNCHIIFISICVHPSSTLLFIIQSYPLLFTFRTPYVPTIVSNLLQPVFHDYAIFGGQVGHLLAITMFNYSN